MAEFVVIKTLMEGVSDNDKYYTTELGANILLWITDLVRTIAAQGLQCPSGKIQIDKNRLSLSGVSLGGAGT